MTAQEYQALAADRAQETAEYQHATVTAQLTGRVFDHAQPLPKQPTYRPREWETNKETT